MFELFALQVFTFTLAQLLGSLIVKLQVFW